MIEKVIRKITKAKNILLLPHINADGDALGSSFALAGTEFNDKKNITVLLEEKIPWLYNFLPFSEKSIVFNNRKVLKNIDLVISIDTGDLDRLGRRREIFARAENKINIDHHKTNTEYAPLNLVDKTASSTGEIIFDIIKKSGEKISEKTAECLYVAISTDTGGFRYSNTTSKTHRIVSKLLDYKIDVNKISRRVFDMMPKRKALLIGLVLSELNIYENGKLALLKITKDMFEKTESFEEDCDGIINYARNIDGVHVAGMLREKGNDRIQINLRSNNEKIDVSDIAKIFQGGGHKRAAGGIYYGSIEDASKKLLGEIRKYL